jgi:hypothetical protein
MAEGTRARRPYGIAGEKSVPWLWNLGGSMEKLRINRNSKRPAGLDFVESLYDRNGTKSLPVSHKSRRVCRQT